MRTYCYGYRSREIPSLCVPTDITSEDRFQLLRYTRSDEVVRDVVQTSLGCHVHGASLPHVDPGDSQTVLDGIHKRIAVEMPEMKEEYRLQFRNMVQCWLKENLVPLPSDSDTSIEHWLDNTHYPAYRKEELKLKNSKILDPHAKRWKKVKSFIKDETYVDWKHARTINSRTDEFKTLVGPYIKLVEKIVLKGSNFIKYVPKRDRPRVLKERFLNKYKYLISTDFSSFEAHFIRLLEDTEFLLYEFMFQNLPKKEEILRLLREGLLEWNECVFKYATIKIWRRRMSGEMSTSLGNGFANLMLLLFIGKLQGETLNPYCEGDDGIAGMNSLPPSKEWLYENLGLELKISICEDLADASFCGNVFDPSDLLVVTNPIEVILGFGWTTSRYAKSSTKRLKELLRSKALSLLHEYPGAPILGSLGRYALRMTEGLRARGALMNEYQREEFALMIEDFKNKGIPMVDPPIGTRRLVTRLYGITISDQIAIEKYLDSKQDLSPIECKELYTYIAPRYAQYYNVYARRVPIVYNLRHLAAPFMPLIV